MGNEFLAGVQQTENSFKNRCKLLHTILELYKSHRNHGILFFYFYLILEGKNIPHLSLNYE